MSYIRLVNVTKRFGNVTAVVAGFEDLSDGEVWVGDRLLSSPKKHHYTPPENRNFGMVFQAFAVWPHMSVYENVAFPLRLRKLPTAEIEQRTKDALTATNLLKAAEESPASLSGGGKQRVALARALAINPDVMLLDEPLSSLDPHLREEMRFEIKDLQRKYGFSIIYVTHDQSEAMALSDRILVMKLGVMQQIDSPLNVYNHPANKFVFSFIGVSSFTDVVWNNGAAYIKGDNRPLPSGLVVPDRMNGEAMFNLASRPTEIRFTNENDINGVRGVVLRKAFLGEIIDYLVKIGDQEVRVQIGRRDHGPETGEVCYLHFLRPFWYKVDE